MIYPLIVDSLKKLLDIGDICAQGTTAGRGLQYAAFRPCASWHDSPRLFSSNLFG